MTNRIRSDKVVSIHGGNRGGIACTRRIATDDLVNHRILEKVALDGVDGNAADRTRVFLSDPFADAITAKAVKTRDGRDALVKDLRTDRACYVLLKRIGFKKSPQLLCRRSTFDRFTASFGLPLCPGRWYR